MRHFRLVISIVFLAAILLVALPLPVPLKWYLLGADLLLFLLVVTYGSARICSGLFLEAECRGNPERNEVAITFDDGPYPVNTPAILDLLAKHGARASFFLTGRDAEKNGELVRQTASAGHTIGSHSYSHAFWFPLFSPARIREEIERTNRVLEQFTGERVRWFRPPFGVTNPGIFRALQGTGMKVAGWSIRSFDTRNEKPPVVLGRISGRLRGGEIILLHETSEHILVILEALLKLLEQRGLKSVSLDEFFNN